MSMHPLKKIIEERKAGKAVGIYSICSANGYVIEAAMDRAKKEGTVVLIESTSNQVNQLGGYTGMKPADFRDFVYSIAERAKFPKERIILGGDHLGPLPWKGENAETAMKNAAEMVRQYVEAGFTKIHIDTSMHLGDDDHGSKLPTEVIARRGAMLCQVAEDAYRRFARTNPAAMAPVYVVGSEVPIPGGAQEEEEMFVTRVEDFRETVDIFRHSFIEQGIGDVWNRVIAVVVQPGVEFGDDSIHEYNRADAAELCAALRDYPDIVFEGHSTDYQTPKALKEMVEDGIAILKVGPALTFALREGIFALNRIENELLGNKPGVELSRFIEVLEAEMLKNPSNWVKHYHGSGEKIAYSRKYSYSDRCRYYLTTPEVRNALERLIRNLKNIDIPMTIISQYLPFQYRKIREGRLAKDPEALLRDKVDNLIDDYVYAVKG